MLCPNCEAENRDDAKFCDECGFPLGGAIARAAAVQTTHDEPPAQSPVESWPQDFDPFDLSTSIADETPSSASISGDVAPVEAEYASEAASEPVAIEHNESSVEVFEATLAFDQDEAAKTQVVVSEETPAQSDPGFDDQDHFDDDVFAGFDSPVDDAYGFYDASNGANSYTAPQTPGHTMQMPRVDADPQQSARRDFRIAASTSKRTPKALLIVIAIAAVAVIAAAVTFAIGLWGGVAVPDVTGMTENDARSVLEDNGFTVRSTQVKSDDTEGLVLIMDPAAGSRAAEGTEVVIHIATARFVPDIVGKSYDDAKALLDEAGYENVRYEKVKSTDKENVVLSVTPDAGTRAKSTMEITVGVSEAYRVPDISGLDLNAAQQAVTAGGLVPQVVYVDTQEYPEGTILGTTPEANTKVSEGDYVSIKVARARAAELVALTEKMFAAGETATVGGTSIAVDSVDAVSYLGDDTVAFKVTGRPFATLMGETVYGSPQTIEGQVVYSEDNEVLSIS